MDKSVTKQQSQAALNAVRAEQSRFKAPPPAVASAPIRQASVSSKIASSGISQKTYHTRRNDFYRSYNYSPPAYAYNSAPSFGMWDAAMLWMILDNVNDKSISQTYYHHMDDPGVKAWRAEAEKQAATNADLRAKLAALDNATSQTSASGVARNTDYVPVGKDGLPAPVLASTVVDKTLPAAKSESMGFLGWFFLFGFVGAGGYAVYHFGFRPKNTYSKRRYI